MWVSDLMGEPRMIDCEKDCEGCYNERKCKNLRHTNPELHKELVSMVNEIWSNKNE